MAKWEEVRAMQDAVRAYVDLALGLTEASRKRATKVAKRLVGKGGATGEQLQEMVEELRTTSLANRESLIRMIRSELERTLNRFGLATTETVADLASRVADLERRLREAEGTGTGPAAGPGRVTGSVAPASAPAAKAAPGTATPAKAATAKAAPAKAAPGKASPANAAGGKAAPANAAPAKKVVAKKAVAKKAVAKKAVAKTVAKKTVAKQVPPKTLPPGGTGAPGAGAPGGTP